MTAKELINHLKDLPTETKICVKGYEDGLDYISLLRKAKIIKSANAEWYYGEHQEVLEIDEQDFDEIVWVIQ
jgi:hypothetical protein